MSWLQQLPIAIRGLRKGLDDAQSPEELGILRELARDQINAMNPHGDYPAETIDRMLDGVLSMEPDDIAQRAIDQNYGPVLYRGHDKRRPPRSNEDMWMSEDINTAHTYNDAMNGTIDDQPGQYYREGLTPLRTNADNLAYVRGDGRHHSSVTTNSIKNKGLAGNPQTQGVHTGTDRIATAVKDSGNYQGTYFRNVKDDFTNNADTSATNNYNILGSRDDVNIRHEHAAYDPQYKGHNIMGNADPRLLAATAAGTAGTFGVLASDGAEAQPLLTLAKGIDAGLASRQLRNKINKERSKGISGEKSVADYIHRNTNYENGFITGAKKWDEGLNGPSYVDGINTMADDLVAGTDDPMVQRAVEDWRYSRLDAGRHQKYGRGGMVAAPSGVLATGARAEDEPRSAREAGFPELPVYEDPNAPLPMPTGWDIVDSVTGVLGMPMAGLQGLARGVYGLATGEDLTTAAAEAAHMMGSEWKGDMMTPGYDTGEGWQRYGALTEDTLNEAGVSEPVSRGLGLFNQWVPQLFMPF
jgi:hypothetical protein